MADDPAHTEKEARRRKQLNKMTKIVSKAWGLSNARPFQESSRSSSNNVVYDLTSIGQNIDEGVYKLGRSGWEQFSRDIGGVYNRHIERKTKYSNTAKSHLDQIAQMLSKLDASLATLASEYCPHEESPQKEPKKRKLIDSTSEVPKKKVISDNKNGDTLTLGEREDNAMEALGAYVEEAGGSRDQVSTFRCKVSRKADGRYDVNYYNSQGRRFRSMVDVGRFLNIVSDHKQAPARKGMASKKPSNFRECENEKKKLRKELDKLLKAHRRATKALDDFQNERKESRYPIDDDILMEKEASNPSHRPLVTPATSPAARIPDIDGFPGVPSHCVPDLIMTWDFLCTFGRALSLNPIQLDDFADALTFTPHLSQIEGDGINPSTPSPPVYLAEAHLGLLKLLLQDQSSDDWWWSILETDDAQPFGDDVIVSDNTAIDSKVPVIKVDMAALLAYEEDPLITASWLQALEEVRNLKANAEVPVRKAVKAAISIATNRWVKAYLRKSIEKWKGNSVGFAKRAVVWLVDKVKDARPDLFGRNIKKDDVLKQKAKVVNEATALMEKMEESGEFVVIDDEDLDAESDDDLESDESDDEDDAGINQPDLSNVLTADDGQDEATAPVTSAIPVKPSPSLVDLLLPPAKPLPGSDLVSPFTWPHVTGAAACRILHRYKRQRNEVDDGLRIFRELPAMSIAERRRREALAASRVLTECSFDDTDESPLERAARSLNAGGNYLGLSVIERLCILRLLIEAAYDAARVHEVVDDNFKARIGAVKALEMEERRAKREAKEEATVAETAAREKLAFEAKAKFLEEKRQEIERKNRRSNEYTEEFIEGLTDDDIMEFDEETKAEYDALPGPENFNKTEVNKMVNRMQEESAFDTNALAVRTMEEILAIERYELADIEKRLATFSDVDLFSTDRETSKTINRLKRDIENAQTMMSTLPRLRETAIEALRDAMQDGTLKALRAAIRLAKQSHLTGPDEETGGLWALDLLRDAAVELKAAEGRKRLVEAQKDLIAKRDKCFIRTEPLGRDRFRNPFWRFDNDKNGHVWVEVDYILKNPSMSDDFKPESSSRYVNLLAEPSDISIGADDAENDIVKPDLATEAKEMLLHFSRQEYHSSGFAATIAKRHWGCHTTEKSLRGLIKSLDERGSRENELKTNLKETLEESGLASSLESGKHDSIKDVNGLSRDQATNGDANGHTNIQCQTSGDEHAFTDTKNSVDKGESSVISLNLIQGISSALGQRVRIRHVLDPSKEHVAAYYKLATVNAWTMNQIENDESHLDGHDEQPMKVLLVPMWRAALDRGGEYWLSGHELIESLCRFARWTNKDVGYSEDDAAFLAYRNSLGRHCGKAADAAYSSSPMFLGRLMVKREQELYMPLKNRSYDNNWGKSGARIAWITSMKDDCFDFRTARSGLLTLEHAFFELTGGVADDGSPVPDAKQLLNDEKARFEIELESIDKNVNGLWNSRESRAIFLEIVETCTTTGFLALALDLLYRNCRVYLDAHKLTATNSSAYVQAPRVTRRMNAWQQANRNWYD